MRRKAMREVLFMVVTTALTAGMVRTALAVDVPRWVAAIFVEAQKTIGLRWNPVAGATGYKVLKSTTKGADYKEITTVTAPQYFDKDVEAGTTYYYVLKAVAGAEASANSEEKSVLIPGVKKIVLGSPEWAVVKAESTTEFGKTSYRVGMKWSKPGSGTAIAYNLYRSNTPGADYTMVTSTSDSQYIDTTVEPNKTYYYVLTALDDQFQESKYSSEQKVEIKEAEKKVAKKKAKKIELVPLLTKPLFVMDNRLDILKAPRDVAVDAKFNVYVTDAVLKKIVIFGPTGEFLNQFGEPGRGPGKLDSPSGVTIGPDGDLYVADMNSQVVHVFTTDGKFLKAITPYLDPRFKLVKPTCVAFSKDGTMFMVDYQNGQVQVFDPNLKYERSFGNKYDETGKLIEPHELWYPIQIGITKGEKEKVFSADCDSTVVVWDLEGKMLSKFGARGASVGTFMYPLGVGYDEKRDWLYIGDKTVNTIQVFDADGNFKYSLSNEQGKGLMGVANPNGFQIIGDKIWISENLSQRYSIYGMLFEQSPPPYKAPAEE